MNQAHCLGSVQSWDEGAGLCLMQGVNEQHARARLDLFLMVFAKFCVRYLQGSLGHTRLFCFAIKSFGCYIKVFKRQLEPNGTIRLHHVTVKFWKKPLLMGKGIRLHTHVYQHGLGTNLLSLLLILSCGCPTTAVDFFHSLRRFKGCSCCCSFPPPCYPQQ